MAETSQPDAERLKAIVKEYLDRGWNDGDLSVVDERFADDYVAHVPFLPEREIRGPERWKGIIGEFRTAFPDIETRVEEIIGEGETIAVRYSWRGTHEGEFLGIEPTGRSVETTGMAVLRFENGLRVEDWIVEDVSSLRRQLGVAEPIADAPEKRDRPSATARDRSRSADRFEDLVNRSRGEVLLPGDERYDEARSIWNGMIDRHPAVIVRCAGAADVIDAVNVARERDLPLSVKAGGHNVSGNAICDDGLVVDLSEMTSVRVDPNAKTVRVEPGATMADLDHETQAYGLATPGGVVSSTGVAGLTLGGGWGWLSRTYGLAIDNLRSVDIVTADGELRRASEDENADLFWGVRGGGGNFGIVTSFEFDCYEVGPEVLAGLIVHPFEDVADHLRFHREVTAEAPDELCCYAAILTAPPEPFLPEEVHGSPVFAFALCYSGDVAEGERAIESLRAYGDPIADLVDTYPYTAFQQILDDAYQPGARNYWKSQFIDPLPDEAIDLLVERAESRTSPLSEILIEHQGGAIGEVAPDATAYPHRDAELTLNIFSRWEDPTEDEEHVEWARESFEAMTPYAADGVYVNFLGEEGEERVKAAYGDNYDRLVELKNVYDPDNLFRMNQNVEPTV